MSDKKTKGPWYDRYDYWVEKAQKGIEPTTFVKNYTQTLPLSLVKKSRSIKEVIQHFDAFRYINQIFMNYSNQFGIHYLFTLHQSNTDKEKAKNIFIKLVKALMRNSPNQKQSKSPGSHLY